MMRQFVMPHFIMMFALDKETGEKLLKFNVGPPVGIGAPSVGNGMLLVTNGIPAKIPALESGPIVVVFGLPEANQTATSAF